MRTNRLSVLVVLGAIAILGRDLCFGLTPKAGGSLDSLIRHQEQIVPARSGYREAGLRPGVMVLESRSNGPWVVEFDHSTSALRRAVGTGLAMFPGTGNSLIGDEPDLAALEAMGRSLLGDVSDLLNQADLTNEWVVLPESSQPLVSGSVRPLRFGRSIGGVPVEGSQIQMVWSHGNLVYLNTTGLEPIEVASAPTLDAAATWASFVRLAEFVVGPLGEVERVGRAELVLLPFQSAPGEMIQYRLVRRHAFRRPGEIETWQAAVDAHRGELIEFFDLNAYACALDPSKVQGQIKGGVRAAEASDPEEVHNFIYPYANDAGVGKNGDSNGFFGYSGGLARSRLEGTFFAMTCEGCSPNPPDASTTSSGIIDFGVGGVNQTSNGTSTPADRTCFYHLNAARAMASKWINRPWMSRTVPAKVNVAMTCNANWDGNGVNFFRSGGGCTNTGEIRDVMQHEWGHGLDDNDGIGAVDRAMGEAYGDHIALFIDRDSCVGQSFSGASNTGPYCHSNPACTVTSTCTGVRNIDEKRSTQGFMNMTRAATVCSNNPCGWSPLSRQCHCESQVFGQSAFHLSYNLLTGIDYDTALPLAAGNPAFSDRAAWFIHERTFFNAAQLMISYAPSHRQSRGTGAYDAYMIVDDDDGNLANGTSHAEYINKAHVHHEIQELTLITDSANCTPPGDPAISVQPVFDPVSGNAQVEITWLDANASFYVVYRNSKLTDAWLPVRIQVLDDNRATYTVYDEPVEIGKAYNYVVMAISASGCPSAGNDVKTLTVGLPDITALVGVVTDPGPGGDADGIPEPGELIRVRVDLREIGGLVELRNATVTLSSPDPLVSVPVAGPLSYGTVAVSGTVNGPSNFEVGVSLAKTCGSSVPLVAAVSAENGCLLRAFSIAIPTTGCVPAARGEAIPETLRGGADNLDPTCTDSDSIPDNGETFAYDVSVRNPGTLPANNVTVTLSSLNPVVAITSTNPVLIPVLPAGSTMSTTFNLVATGAACQETADLVATVNSTSNSFPIAKQASITLEDDRVPFLISADFEVDFGAWTAVGFARTMARRNGGLWSVYAGPGTGHACDASGDGASGCSSLTSPAFVPGVGCQLQLANWYRLEDPDTQYWDRANVHVIDVASGVHTVITPLTRPYQGGNGDATALCHINNENGWAGSTAGAAWGNALFDLATYADREIQLEINYNSDTLAICEGLFVDDIVVTNALRRQCDALTCGGAVPDVEIESCTASDRCLATGSGDGVIDPGDEVTHSLTLRNVGAAAANDVQGTVTVAGGTIVVGGSIGGSPQLDIASGGSYVHTVVVRVTGVCGDVLDIDITNLRAGTTAFPGDTATCDRSIGASAPAGSVVTSDTPAPAVAIPETLPTLTRGVNWTLPATVTSATLAVTVNHGRIGDLSAWLVGPLGGFVNADAALNGSLAVTALVAAEGNGGYQLVLWDKVKGEIGTLTQWSLTVGHDAYSSCNACVGGCSAPAFSITPRPSTICADGNVAFDSVFTDVGSGGFDYEWDFGDGSGPLAVSNPLAPVVHRFDSTSPNYMVSLRAISRTQPSCDALASTLVTIDLGTAPSGGAVGNRLQMYRRSAAAELSWIGSPVSPPRFNVHKTNARLELADSAIGIGDEPILARTAFDRATDPGAVATAPSLVFYEVHPATSCEISVFP